MHSIKLIFSPGPISLFLLNLGFVSHNQGRATWLGENLSMGVHTLFGLDLFYSVVVHFPADSLEYRNIL